MAFVELPENVTHAGRDRLSNCVRAAISTQGTVQITVSADIHQKLGSPKACRIMVGTDDHEGKIAILPLKSKAKGTLNFTTNNKSAVSPKVQIRASRLSLKDNPRATTTIPHEVTDLGLIVDVRPLMKPVASLVAA